MSLKGKIFAFVGVIGSGKTYRAEQLYVDAACNECSLIVGDFSDGIRQTLMNIFLGEDRAIDCSSKEYAKWKVLSSSILLPFPSEDGSCHFLLDITEVEGRELLQRTGEYLKKLAGDAVWAEWTYKNVIHHYTNLSEKDKESADVVFGSVRFDCEAEVVFNVAQALDKDVEFIFCDYPSSSYEINFHISERFAQYFLNQGCVDGENITELVKEKIGRK